MLNHLNKNCFHPLRKDNKQQGGSSCPCSWVDHVLPALSRSIPLLSQQVKEVLQVQIQSLQNANEFRQIALVSSSRLAATDMAATLSVLYEALTRHHEQVAYLRLEDGCSDEYGFFEEFLQESFKASDEKEPHYILIEDQNQYQVGEAIQDIPAFRVIHSHLNFLPNIRVIYMISYQNDDQVLDAFNIREWVNDESPGPLSMITYPAWNRNQIHAAIDSKLTKTCKDLNFKADRLMTLPEIWARSTYYKSNQSKYDPIKVTIEHNLDMLVHDTPVSSTPSILPSDVWLGFTSDGTTITLWQHDQEYGSAGLGVNNLSIDSESDTDTDSTDKDSISHVCCKLFHLMNNCKMSLYCYKAIQSCALHNLDFATKLLEVMVSLLLLQDLDQDYLVLAYDPSTAMLTMMNENDQSLEINILDMMNECLSVANLN